MRYQGVRIAIIILSCFCCIAVIGCGGKKVSPEAVADSMRKNADSMRKNADSMRKNADSMRKDAISLRENADLLQRKNEEVQKTNEADIQSMRKNADTMEANAKSMESQAESMENKAESMQNSGVLQKNTEENIETKSTESMKESSEVIKSDNQELGNPKIIDGKTSSFERFDSKFLGHKYYASGVADVVGNDDNAILVTITSSKDVNVVIKGNIEYESGEADLYLVNPDRNEKCILPGDSIKENKKINKKVVLEAGSNEIILKGDRSVVDFDLEFITEGNGASISYDN